MPRTTTKVRAFESDNDFLKLISLKVSAKREKITTTAEVINGIIKIFRESRDNSVEKISAEISDELSGIVRTDY